jgi:proliferating cell nuclear antigen PCNA
MVKYLVNIKTDKINIIKDIFSMLEGVSSEDINIVFRKDETKNKDSDTETNSDSESDSSKNSSKKKTKQNKGGIIIKSMSNNLTSLSLIKLELNLFTNFFVKKDEHSFWTNVKDLNLWLKSIDSENHTLNIFIEKNDEKTIKFKSYHNEKENKFKSYEQSFTEPDTEISSIPKIEFDYAISINAQLFKKICNDMKKFSDYMEIKCEENQVLFQCLTKANKLNVASYESGDGDVESKKINKNIKSAKSTFYLEYLLKLKYTSNICDNITLHIKNKSPLFINNSIGDDENNYGKLLLYFSPYDNDLTNDDYHDKMKSFYKEKEKEKI